jgi:hypothetical protein
MQEKPAMGQYSGLRYGFPAAWPNRARDILRRKLIRKMVSRRQRAAKATPLLRRVF